MRVRCRLAEPVSEQPLAGPLADWLPLTVTEVSTPRHPERALCEGLLHQHHYLSHRSPVGENLQYLVRERGGRPVACLLFGAARDRHIGWDGATRARRLQLLTNNTRFLILPWVRVPHLASCVLVRVTRRPHVKIRRARQAQQQQQHSLAGQIVAAGQAARTAAAITQDGLTPAELAAWRADYEARLQAIQHHPEHTLGHIEEAIAAAAQEPLRLLTERTAQAKAKATPCQCPECHQEAHRHGLKAQARRAETLAQRDTWESLQALAGERPGPPVAPFTLVIEIDAWNIRERDEWGQTQARRQQGQKVERWHWVYMATVFRLDHRGQTAGGRALINARGYVATRLGLEALTAQLHREALQRGRGQAQPVLVIADGAVWIWNLAKDRFPNARQRLDLWHVEEHLWSVAHELHGRGTPEART